MDAVREVRTAVRTATGETQVVCAAGGDTGGERERWGEDGWPNKGRAVAEVDEEEAAEEEDEDEEERGAERDSIQTRLTSSATSAGCRGWSDTGDERPMPFV